ncbi:MAG TPA: uroporphyrinogen-III synthase [Eoetvoesiella sp.]
MVGQGQIPFAVLTRPEGKNALLSARLQACGVATLELPALSIQILHTDDDKLPLPGDYDLVVFVSGNAVRIYLELLARRLPAVSWPETTLAATVGEASALPLYQAGTIPHQNIFHPRFSDSQQDSEALWNVLRPSVPALKRILIVRGETGREWLGQQFEQAGATVRRHAVYRREPALWSRRQLQDVIAAAKSAKPFICLFTSAESVDAFHLNLRRNKVEIFDEHTIFIAIHGRIASRLQLLIGEGSGKVYNPVVKICSPSDDAIFETVVSAAFPLKRR